MRPILYPSQQTEFVNNGYGVLSDILSCKCTEVLNGEYEIELKAPKDGNHVSDILINCVIKVKPNYEDDPQPFRIYSVEQDIDGLIVAKAAHISYDTAGIPVLPFKSENLTDAVDQMNINRKVNRASEFLLHANFSADGVLEVKTPSSFRALLGGSDDTVANVYGGEYHFDNYTVELLERRGVDKGVCFRYGKNIKDFEQEINSEDLYSAVFGFWKKSGSEGTPDTFVYGDVIEVENVLPYDKIYVLDTSDKIKNEDESDPTPEQVNEYVNQYIANYAIGIPNYSMKISYAEDDNIIQVCLGDTVGVVFPDYGINVKARCSKVVFDCLLERNDSIEIGVVNTGIGTDIAAVSNKTTTTSKGTASNFSGQTTSIRQLETNKAGVYYDTIAGWASQPDLVAKKGAIYIYTDKTPFPGIKIGDGVTLLSALSFIGSETNVSLARSGETLILNT